MKRLVVAWVLAAGLVGCDSAPPAGDPAPPAGDPALILTGPPGLRSDDMGCFTDAASGPLVVDRRYGTAIIDGDVGGARSVVAWRPGITARWAGSEIEVLDPNGAVIAVTGRTYLMDGGYVSAGGSSGLRWPELPIGVFWACGRVNPLPAATASPGSE